MKTPSPRRRSTPPSRRRTLPDFGGPLPEPSVRTAHDVRHLAPCAGCAGIGDNRHMLAAAGGPYWHGRCLILARGFRAVLAYPQEQLRHLTIGDLGPTYMRRLLDHLY